MRDLGAIRTAMQVAGKGHWIFDTMHTANAAHTVQRLIDMFSPNQHELPLIQLAVNLKAIVNQRLAKIRKSDSIPVVEIVQSPPVIE